MNLHRINQAALALARLEARLGSMLERELHGELMDAVSIMNEVRLFAVCWDNSRDQHITPERARIERSAAIDRLVQTVRPEGSPVVGSDLFANSCRRCGGGLESAGEKGTKLRLRCLSCGTVWLRRKPTDRLVCTDGGMREAGFNERNDCAVRAASIALGIPYAEAHARYKALGRRSRCGTPNAIIGKVLGAERQHEIDQPTFAQWSKAHTRGRYVVWVRGHVFAYIDGVQHDNHANQYRPRARVLGYYRLA